MAREGCVKGAGDDLYSFYLGKDKGGRIYVMKDWRLTRICSDGSRAAKEMICLSRFSMSS